MLQIKDNISNKGYYRFIENISKLTGCSLTHEKIKLISFDLCKAESMEEIKLKKFVDAYQYVINNQKQLITCELLENIYFLLVHREEKEKIKKIIEEIYKNIDAPIHSLVAHIHLYIINVLENNNIEFAFLVSNLLLLRENRNPIIPYLSDYSVYRKIIKDRDLFSLSNFFYFIERKFKNTEYDFLSKEEIINTIKVHKDLIKKDFNVAKLYLFGSFVSEQQISTSDIDLVVIFQEDLINIERKRKAKELIFYLSTIFGRTVDLINFHNALDKFEMNDLEKLITLI